VGSDLGGLKGDFSGSVTLGISSSAGLTVDPNVSVHAYAGYGGSWHGMGTVGADVDMSGSNFRFCKSKTIAGKTFKICIP